jgi:hypothetical protein
MMFAAERIAARLGLSGFFGLDFMIDDESGATYLIEMNPRCTPLCHLQLGGRRDMVGALWSQLTEQPPRFASPLTNSDLIAYFPQARNSNSEFLEASFHDVPEGEPALTEELLHPWSERSLLGRLLDKVRQVAAQRKAPSACVFSNALAPRASSPVGSLTAPR